MKDLIRRTFNMLSFNVSIEDIHNNLISEGLNEYQAFLTYKAAMIFYNSNIKSK
jgi:hypothetical protein